MNMADLPKENAARAALSFVRRGMCIGLGTGRTANIFTELLGERERREHLGLSCIPTSMRTEELAESVGLHITDFQEVRRIDVAVDGADVVSPDFALLKGMGGALSREKIVAYRAKKFVVIVDEGKMKKKLEGTVPIEEMPFAAPAVLREIRLTCSRNAAVRLNAPGSPFVTDNGNHIIDAPMRIANISQAERLEFMINNIPGVLENGIFTRADVVLVGIEKGCRRLVNRRGFGFPYLRNLKA